MGVGVESSEAITVDSHLKGVSFKGRFRELSKILHLKGVKIVINPRLKGVADNFQRCYT